MTIRCVWEHNGEDTLLYAVDFVGAYTRGENLDVAISKMPSEVKRYVKWLGMDEVAIERVEIVEEKKSDLEVKDADSDVLFKKEELPLTKEEYAHLKELALKSAKDFLALYEHISDKDKAGTPLRKTFYGQVPRTAREMYEHTKNVNAYYFSEIGVCADNEGDIYECRRKGFETIEKELCYLENKVIEGSYGERWSLCKVLRRFIWHDRIHARAMYRLAVRLFGEKNTFNPFYF